VNSTVNPEKDTTAQFQISTFPAFINFQIKDDRFNA